MDYQPTRVGYFWDSGLPRDGNRGSVRLSRIEISTLANRMCICWQTVGRPILDLCSIKYVQLCRLLFTQLPTQYSSSAISVLPPRPAFVPETRHCSSARACGSGMQQHAYSAEHGPRRCPSSGIPKICMAELDSALRWQLIDTLDCRPSDIGGARLYRMRSWAHIASGNLQSTVQHHHTDTHTFLCHAQARYCRTLLTSG